MGIEVHTGEGWESLGDKLRELFGGGSEPKRYDTEPNHERYEDGQRLFLSLQERVEAVQKSDPLDGELIPRLVVPDGNDARVIGYAVDEALRESAKNLEPLIMSYAMGDDMNSRETIEKAADEFIRLWEISHLLTSAAKVMLRRDPSESAMRAVAKLSGAQDVESVVEHLSKVATAMKEQEYPVAPDENPVATDNNAFGDYL